MIISLIFNLCIHLVIIDTIEKMMHVFGAGKNFPLVLTCSACSTTFILELDVADHEVLRLASETFTNLVISGSLVIKGDFIGRDKNVTVINGAYAEGEGATAVAARGVSYGSNDKIPANIITGDNYNG